MFKQIAHLQDSHRYLISRFAGVAFFIAIVVTLLPKSISFVHLNPVHNGVLDLIFLVITFLGDGIFAVALAIMFFSFGNRLLAAKIATGFITAGLIVQVGKLLSRCPRPQAFFAEGYYPHFIPGVTHSGRNSFPSGHTTVAFVLAGIICCNSKSINVCRVTFWSAVAVGYSRIYLGQHFAEDVLFGMFVGLATAFLIEVVFKKRNDQRQAGTAPQMAVHEL